MNTEHRLLGLTPQAYAALLDAAKLHAAELRREAIRDFWSSLARALRKVPGATRRLWQRCIGRPRSGPGQAPGAAPCSG